MRFLRTLRLLITHDDDGSDVAFEPREESRAESSDDSDDTDPFFERYASGVLAVEGGDEVEIPFGGLETVSVVYIETDVRLNLVIDGAGAVPIDPGTGDSAVFFMETADITSLALVNPGSGKASAVFALLGS